ncbi:MAG: EAL domain-containing protein [Burkholderiaceae bacterium]|nr:EAL domain-containing protein [Burkholderiaceae bacterium]
MSEPAGAQSPSAMFVPGDTDMPGTAMKAISVDREMFHRHSAFDAKDAIIMMVDDELLNIEMTQAFLEDAGYRNFVSTHESEHAVRLMREKQPHVLLLDLSMPRVSGMDILARLHEDEQLRLIPVIVLTSNTDPASKLGALSMGAMDFLSKPVDPSELALRLRNTLAARAHRDYLAHHDPLTGLPNRLRYRQDVDAALLNASKRNHGMALLHVGADRLSQVNDALGRAAGDALLYRMSKRLRQCVEGSDLALMEEQMPTLYRFDGDEFAVLVPWLDEIESAAGLVGGLLEAGAVRLRVADRDVFVTASIGVTVFPGDGRSANELMSNAGVAMRQAKQLGGNTYEFFSAKLNQRAVSELRMGGDMRRAMARDELVLLYQPKIDIKTGRVMGAETVVRWNHPSGKVLQGEEVLRMAATFDMSMVLTEWMVDQVVEQASAWDAEDLLRVPLGINVMLKNLPMQQAMEMVLIALRGKIRPEWLCLELNEFAQMSGADFAPRATARLREMGVRVALDNFGSADASLVHLGGALSLDEIKLDAGLIAGVETNGAHAAIVQAMIAMARKLGLSLVATGVDSMKQLAFLKNIDADQYQGLVSGPPLTGGDFSAKHLVAARKDGAG